MGKGVPKYSLRARSQSKAYQLTPQSYPGPGAYECRPTITKEGKMLMSKYRSSGATTFNPPRSARFGGEGSKHQPGPGQYSPRLDMTKEGKYYIQKFSSSGARTFYHHNRKTMDNNSTARLSPGPGSYRMPSDFGFYESKHAKKFSRT